MVIDFNGIGLVQSSSAEMMILISNRYWQLRIVIFLYTKIIYYCSLFENVNTSKLISYVFDTQTYSYIAKNNLVLYLWSFQKHHFNWQNLHQPMPLKLITFGMIVDLIRNIVNNLFLIVTGLQEPNKYYK